MLKDRSTYYADWNICQIEFDVMILTATKLGSIVESKQITEMHRSEEGEDKKRENMFNIQH